ncbi:MAG: hypothetical protein KME16_06815 [Scytolyngbya sp. HA4215-MV1]|jgi:hypothetical protein|nr:hypothetical protein [Scytolyngbya sp. HA4215-MV1]
MKPESLDQLFPAEQQVSYVSLLMKRGGLTRRRAEYFVRLWGYLLLKQKQESEGRNLKPLTQLYPPEGLVACTHREAAEVFYGNQERGSDRAAGMMIDRLVALGLLEKRFDGQTLCLQIMQLPELLVSPSQIKRTISLEMDDFNPRTDAIPAANLIARAYAELIQSNRSLKDPLMASHKIVKVLRGWSQQYGKGIRVLRRTDNHNPVGIFVIYPVASESESIFYQPFSKGVYLTSDTEVDPFKAAVVGDEHCAAAYIRAWTIDMSFLNRESLHLCLEDTQKTLLRVREDFPNLCDLYSAFVHPMYEELKLVLGFQEISSDKQRAYSWVYLAVDRFLEKDMQQIAKNLKFGGAPKNP